MDKKSLILFGSIVASGTVVAIAITRKKKVSPAPVGELKMEITPIAGFDFGDVRGQVATSILVRLTGKALSGIPAPDMVVKLYDNGVLKDTMTKLGAVLNAEYYLDVYFAAPTDVGGHVVYGLMSLTNEVGSVQYQTPDGNFTIGESPTGEITVTVTPQ